MPRVWQIRFTGCWWLEAYCAIHWLLVRPPSMGDDTPASTRRGNTNGEDLHRFFAQIQGQKGLRAWKYEKYDDDYARTSDRRDA